MQASEAKNIATANESQDIETAFQSSDAPAFLFQRISANQAAMKLKPLQISRRG